MLNVGFAGYAVGGLSVGESKKDMHLGLENVLPLVPENKVRYLMGVGAIEDLWECASNTTELICLTALSPHAVGGMCRFLQVLGKLT